MNRFVMLLFILLLCQLFCLETVRSDCHEYHVGDVPTMKNRINDYALIEKSQAPSLGNCSEICALDSSCVTFFYNSETRQCQTHRILLQPDPTDQIEGNWRYYQIYSENCHQKYGLILYRKENICYFLSTKNKTWDDANYECATRRWRLMKITRKEIQDHLDILLIRYPETYYIGLKSKDANNQWTLINNTSNEYEPLNTNQWVWTDGEDLHGFTNWTPEQTISVNVTCVSMNASEAGRWNNQECSETLNFICEKII